jgi:hypothetical protein
VIPAIIYRPNCPGRVVRLFLCQAVREEVSAFQLTDQALTPWLSSSFGLKRYLLNAGKKEGQLKCLE